MSLGWSIVLVAIVAAASAGVLLLVRRRAPDGSVFADGDRAAGVFGVLATGFSVLLGLIVFLAFSSYDESRTSAETEATLVLQQYETAQFMPAAVRGEIGGELVCYARSVVGQEWPQLRAGERVEGFNPWGAKLFRSLQGVEPKTASEQTAYDNWFDRTADREQARSDRIHGSEGVIPEPLWLVMFFIAGTIFVFMLLFADSGERWLAQAAMMASVMAVITATLLLIVFLNNPVRSGFGGLEPVAMQRTLRVLDQERALTGDHTRPPCASGGAIST
jgi:hypothetical protein